MEMPQLTPEHQALALLAGTWLGAEHIYPSPFDSVGGAAVGRVQNRIALDGFAVIQEYEQERNGSVNFRGHGIFRWDSAQYVLYWFDSLGLPPREYRGTLEGQVLALTAAHHQGFSRATFDFVAADRYLYRLEVSPDGEQWFVFTEGTYQRQ